MKTVAADITRTYYHLHESTPENIKDIVDWLVTSSRFAYGEVNIKVPELFKPGSNFYLFMTVLEQDLQCTDSLSKLTYQRSDSQAVVS